MIACLHLLVGLGLVILQTTLLAELWASGGLYDLLVPYVVYLGLNRPLREGAAVLLPLAVVMDTLSGAPFALYTTAYFWLYTAMRAVIRLFRVGNSILLPLVLAAAVAIQDLLFAAMTCLLGENCGFDAVPLRTMLLHFGWALVTGPMVYWLAGTVERRWSHWRSRWVTAQGRH